MIPELITELGKVNGYQSQHIARVEAVAYLAAHTQERKFFQGYNWHPFSWGFRADVFRLIDEGVIYSDELCECLECEPVENKALEDIVKKTWMPFKKLKLIVRSHYAAHKQMRGYLNLEIDRYVTTSEERAEAIEFAWKWERGYQKELFDVVDTADNDDSTGENSQVYASGKSQETKRK